jgi:hypothetical protein
MVRNSSLQFCLENLFVSKSFHPGYESVHRYRYRLHFITADGSVAYKRKVSKSCEKAATNYFYIQTQWQGITENVKAKLHLNLSTKCQKHLPICTYKFTEFHQLYKFTLLFHNHVLQLARHTVHFRSEVFPKLLMKIIMQLQEYLYTSTGKCLVLFLLHMRGRIF